MSPIAMMCALEFHCLAHPQEDGTYATNREGGFGTIRRGLLQG